MSDVYNPHIRTQNDTFLSVQVLWCVEKNSPSTKVTTIQTGNLAKSLMIKHEPYVTSENTNMAEL